MIIYDLKVIADKIAKAANSEAVLDSLFENEYLINNVTDEILTNNGFKFLSYDSQNKTSIYQMENLLCCYKDNILHIFKQC